MKEYLSLIFILCVLSFTVNPAAAVTDQGLGWGLEIGDRFDFHFVYVDSKNPVYSREFDFYFEVVSLTTIPNDITGLTVPYFNISCAADYYFANGTALGAYVPILPGLTLPVGNWSLWTSIIQTMEHPSADYATFDAVESGETWSYSVDWSIEDTMHTQGSATYLKSDGVLTRYDWNVWDSTGSPLFEYHLTRPGYEGGLPVVVIVGIGIGIAAVVVILFLAKRT